MVRSTRVAPSHRVPETTGRSRDSCAACGRSFRARRAAEFLTSRLASGGPQSRGPGRSMGSRASARHRGSQAPAVCCPLPAACRCLRTTQRPAIHRIEVSLRAHVRDALPYLPGQAAGADALYKSFRATGAGAGSASATDSSEAAAGAGNFYQRLLTGLHYPVGGFRTAGY